MLGRCRVAVVDVDEHDVLGLEIAVDDTLGVRGAQRSCHLLDDAHGAHRLDAKLARLQLVEQLAEALALDQLEHEEERAIGQLAEVARRDDVGVRDVTGRDRFTLEPRHDLGCARHRRVQDLERHLLAHVDVLGAVDGAHAAFAQHLDDAVAIGDDGSGR